VDLTSHVPSGSDMLRHGLIAPRGCGSAHVPGPVGGYRGCQGHDTPHAAFGGTVAPSFAPSHSSLLPQSNSTQPAQYSDTTMNTFQFASLSHTGSASTVPSGSQQLSRDRSAPIYSSPQPMGEGQSIHFPVQGSNHSVQPTQPVLQSQQTTHELPMAPSVFDMIDVNHDGVITRSEFDNAVEVVAPGTALTYMPMPPQVTDGELNQPFQQLVTGSVNTPRNNITRYATPRRFAAGSANFSQHSAQTPAGGASFTPALIRPTSGYTSPAIPPVGFSQAAR